MKNIAQSLIQVLLMLLFLIKTFLKFIMINIQGFSFYIYFILTSTFVFLFSITSNKKDFNFGLVKPLW